MSLPRYNQSRYTNWNKLPCLIDDVSPDSASCRREYLRVAGGNDQVKSLMPSRSLAINLSSTK